MCEKGIDVRARRSRQGVRRRSSNAGAPRGVIGVPFAGVQGGEVDVQPGHALREAPAQGFEEVFEADAGGSAASRSAVRRSKAR